MEILVNRVRRKTLIANQKVTSISVLVNMVKRKRIIVPSDMTPI